MMLIIILLITCTKTSPNVSSLAYILHVYMSCHINSSFLCPPQFIPMPVLYGVFLYMGVASLNGVQVSFITLTTHSWTCFWKFGLHFAHSVITVVCFRPDSTSFKITTMTEFPF